MSKSLRALRQPDAIVSKAWQRFVDFPCCWIGGKLALRFAVITSLAACWLAGGLAGWRAPSITWERSSRARWKRRQHRPGRAFHQTANFRGRDFSTPSAVRRPAAHVTSRQKNVPPFHGPPARIVLGKRGSQITGRGGHGIAGGSGQMTSRCCFSSNGQ